MTATDTSAQLFERVQELQGRLDAAPESATRELADDLVSAVVQLYGDGLERIVHRLLARGEDGARIAAELTDDPLVSTLLLIHDLHPIALEQRVQAALESVRPYMESHGGNVELLSLEDGVARLRLEGSCSDCSASSVTLELAIKQALEEAAPDLDELIVEGVADPPTLGPPPDTADTAWCALSLTEPGEGELAAVEAGPHRLVLATVDGVLLAYQDECASCGSPLHGGELTSGALACPACQRSYFLPRAGRSMDAERLQLAPVPLLRENGSVKVALAL